MNTSFKQFLEVMIQPGGPTDLKLNYTQRRVLRKVLDAGDPKLAVQQIATSKDARNLMANAKTLIQYGYLNAQPEYLDYNDEPNFLEITDKGQQIADEYNVQQDQTLITPEEQQQAAPTTGGEPAPGGAGGMGGGGAMGGDLGGELGGELGSEEELGAEEEPGAEGEVPGEELGGEETPGETPPTGEEEPPPEQEEVLKRKLRLSSFFQDVNDLSKYLKT